MTCDESAVVIAASCAGRVPPAELETLMVHLEQCPACRAEAATQLVVTRILASRPREPSPDGLAGRLSARLDIEARSLAFDWRTWSLRFLPVAAALALVAWSTAWRHPSDAAVDLPDAVASFGLAEYRTTALPVGPETSDAEALATLLADESSRTRRGTTR